MFDKVESAKKKHGNTRMQWIMVFVASIALLSYGLEIGWISPTTKILQSHNSPTGYPLTDEEMMWVGSILSFTAVFGVSFYAYIADTFGRKIGVLAVAIPQLLAWIIKLTATNTWMLIAARVISGFPAGGCFNVLPMYVREISQDEIRGATVSVMLMMQSVGLLVMYVMGSYLSYYAVIWIALSVSLIGTVAMLLAPESPAFLVKKEKKDKAEKTVALLRGLDKEDKSVKYEVTTMTNNDQHFKSLPKMTFRTIFNNRVWRRGFVSAILIVLSQAGNGTYAIINYAWTILSSMGVALNPDVQTFVVPSIMIFGSMVSVITIEKLGRKVLAITTYALTTVAMICLGTVLLLKTYGILLPPWVTMISIAVVVWSYSAGITPAFYVVMAEIFNFQVRAKQVGVIISFAWFISAMQLFIFTTFSELFGMHTMFYVFAAINLYGGVATLVLLPETKGKSIEEIEEILAK